MCNIWSLVICVQLFQKIYVSGWNSRGAWKGTISNRFEPSGHAAAGIFKLQLVPFVSLIRLSENQCGSVNLQVCQRICKKYTRQLAAKLCRVSSRKFARSVQLWISHSRKTKYCCGGQHVTVIKLPHRLGLVRRWHSLCTSWRISSVPSMLASVRGPDLAWSTGLVAAVFCIRKSVWVLHISDKTWVFHSFPTSLCQVAGQQITCLDDTACTGYNDCCAGALVLQEIGAYILPTSLGHRTCERHSAAHHRRTVQISMLRRRLRCGHLRFSLQSLCLAWIRGGRSTVQANVLSPKLQPLNLVVLEYSSIFHSNVFRIRHVYAITRIIHTFS